MGIMRCYVSPPSTVGSCESLREPPGSPLSHVGLEGAARRRCRRSRLWGTGTCAKRLRNNPQSARLEFGGSGGGENRLAATAAATLPVKGASILAPFLARPRRPPPPPPRPLSSPSSLGALPQLEDLRSSTRPSAAGEARGVPQAGPDSQGQP